MRVRSTVCSRSFAILLSGVISLSLLSASPSQAQNAPILINPPKQNYKAVCKPQADKPVAITRDWSQWDGKSLKLKTKDAVAVAMEYSNGNARVKPSQETALAILRAAQRENPAQFLSLQLPMARALSRVEKSPESLKQAEQLMLKALASGNLRAAYALGQFYGDGGPAEVRDPAKAKFYYQKSAVANDPDGLIEYARLVTSDANTSDDAKRIAVTGAIVGLMKQLKQGDCTVLDTIGQFYLRGVIVPKDVNTALKWLEAYASTGDAKTALNLAGIYASSRVEQIDIQKAMTYLKQAADEGMVTAQFNLGKAYATGISVDADQEKAIKYLKAASTQKSESADEWLARVYSGEFGLTPDPETADRYFKKAMASNKASSDFLVIYGKFLAQHSATADEMQKIITMLKQASDSGSVDATSALGRIYIDLGTRDPKYYPQAILFLNAAAKFGNSDAATKLSDVFACGRGTTISTSTAKEWRHNAAMYGSLYAVSDTGLSLLKSEDPAEQAKGRDYMIQAAYKGEPDAIGYMVARWERGADGFEANPKSAQRLLKFVSLNNDSKFRVQAALAIIENRFAVAATDTEREAQLAALTPYLKQGDVDAYLAEADLLQRMGRDTPKRLAEINKFLAESGNARGMREYAKVLQSGAHPNNDEARKWLEKASNLGDLKAKLMLIDPASRTASGEIARVADSGSICKVDGMVSVARSYFNLSNPDAGKLADTWLGIAKGAMTGSSDDVYAVGKAYFDGIGGRDHIVDAEPYLLKAVELGKPEAMRDLAEGHVQRLWKDSDPAKAKAYLLRLAGRGDQGAANRLLQLVAEGEIRIGLTEVTTLVNSLGGDVEKPAKYMLQLARLNLDGRFGHVDPALAVDWLRQSADAGEPNAMYRLYQAYFFGMGTPRDMNSALDWLQKAAEAGKPEAIKAIAVAYRIGLQGFPNDPEKAAYWEAKLREISNN